MIRHIFTAPVKEGTPDEVVEQKIDEMRTLEQAVDGIDGFTIGRNLRWISDVDAVSMVVDLEDRKALDALMTCPEHQRISEHASEAFIVEGFSISQIEI